MILKFFLWLNNRFPKFSHPFNQAENGAFNLNYSHYEYENAKKLFKSYDDLCEFEKFIKDKKIADFCCGGGGKSVYLAKKGAAEVYGIDLNENFIDQAKKIAKEKKQSNKCIFVKENVQNTNLKSDYFDAVIFNDAIEHIRDPKQALLEAKRILKNKGKIFINFESYYYFFGHHLWDAITIPWLHLFTTEKFRIKLYKKAVEKFPDGQARVNFRISKNENGEEYISYLNRITLKKFEEILREIEKEGLYLEWKEYSTFNKPIFKLLAKQPILREVFSSTAYFCLKKID